MIPSKPVFTTKVDKQKRIYFTAYSNIKSNAVVSIGQDNAVIEGNPKINLRVGKSIHGNELVFELLRTGKIIYKTKNSKHDSIEIYMPLEVGIQFLQQTLEQGLKFLDENAEKTEVQ